MGVIAFSLGGVDVYWYGLMTSAAIIAGLAVTSGHVLLLREDFSKVMDLLIYGIPTGLFFGRSFYVCLHWDLFRENWGEVFRLHHGGLSAYGVLFGFLVTVFFYAYWHRVSFWHWLDVLTPALILGMAILQLSHFVFQLSVGMPVTAEEAAHSRIAEYVEYAFRPSGFESYEYFRPVALYQGIWQMTVFFLMALLAFFQAMRQRSQEGTLFLLSMLLLFIGRFCFGFWYLTTNPSGTLHFGQLVALAGAVFCSGLLIVRVVRRKRSAASFKLRF